MFKNLQKFISRLLPHKDSMALKGEVILRTKDGEETLGNNLVLARYRIHVANMMVNPTYSIAEGWPAGLMIGGGTKPAHLDDQTLEAPFEDDNGPIVLPLLVETSGDLGKIDEDEFSVTYTATLPEAMEVYQDDGGLSLLKTDFTIEEWGLISGGSNPQLLARKVKSYTKESPTTVEIQWKIYL